MQALSSAEILRSVGRVNMASDQLKTEFWGQTADVDVARRDAQAQIQRYLLSQKVMFETREINLLPEPFIFSRSLISKMERNFEHLHAIVERIYGLYLESAEVREFFNLPPMIEELIKVECNTRPFVFLCRYDFTLNASGQQKIYELNTAGPAALVFSKFFLKAIQSTESYRIFSEGCLFPMEAFKNQRLGVFPEALVHAAKRNSNSSLVVGLINSKINTMVNELAVFEQEIRESGHQVVRDYLENLEVKDGKTFANGVPIDVAFAKIDVCPGFDFQSPLTRIKKDAENLLNGIRAGLPFVNSFVSSWLLDNKSVLAFLKSELADPILSPDDKKLIENIIPDTFLVNRLRPEELIYFAENKDHYVLKKSLDTRGRSVVIGQDVEKNDWNSKLHEASVEPHENYVLQKYEAPETCLYNGRELNTSHAYYLLQGRAMGAFTRSSYSRLTNVGQGGAVQATLVGGL